MADGFQWRNELKFNRPAQAPSRDVFREHFQPHFAINLFVDRRIRRQLSH
jgi:hypothetical protein